MQSVVSYVVIIILVDKFRLGKLITEDLRVISIPLTPGTDSSSERDIIVSHTEGLGVHMYDRGDALKSRSTSPTSRAQEIVSTSRGPLRTCYLTRLLSNLRIKLSEGVGGKVTFLRSGKEDENR